MLSLDVISNVQVLKEASFSFVLVKQVGAYCKVLKMIETPLRIHLQLLVPAFISSTNTLVIALCPEGFCEQSE